MQAPDPRQDPGAIQQRIDRARQGLLGGRGPGATHAEIAPNQRARTTIGGQAAAEEREAVAENISLARGDQDGIEDLIAAHRARLAGDLTALRQRLRPPPCSPAPRDALVSGPLRRPR